MFSDGVSWFSSFSNICVWPMHAAAATLRCRHVAQRVPRSAACGSSMLCLSHITFQSCLRAWYPSLRRASFPMCICRLATRSFDAARCAGDRQVQNKSPQPICPIRIVLIPLPLHSLLVARMVSKPAVGTISNVYLSACRATMRCSTLHRGPVSAQ